MGVRQQAMRLQPYLKDIGRHRRAEQKPLSLIAAVPAQAIGSWPCLHTFCHDGQPQIMAEGDRTARDPIVAGCSMILAINARSILIVFAGSAARYASDE
jgi:hypothetical protein